MNKGKDFLMDLLNFIKSRRKIPLLIAGGIFLLCLIFGIVRWKAHKAEEAMIRENVVRLENMASEGLEETEEELRTLQEKEAEARAAEAAAQQKEDEANFTARDISSLRQSFQGSMILGDSITEGLVSYQFLDSSVVAYARGKSVAKNDDLIQTAMNNKPQRVFMAFGMNDLGFFNGVADNFIAAYKEDVQALQEGIPDVEIYINSILPMTEAAIAKNQYLAQYTEFNQRLEEMCQEMGLTYIDNTFIVEQHPEFHEEDGLHMSKSYYPLWMTNMAIKAGI